ncbi:N-acetyltransferase family protein [Nonomuraea muscovyensis]|uniref:GNAT superfamily N-acetyltransferase n=1 Tax=Nonomuraea muscovyensis TaxID=1124761 RepID=A0A7X0BXE7_9ACTN|nr:GNAT family N-acetyltransferase [Nonomuraea muscovyensis]MBB6344605.1 GNAT superfamily N-acetyltransferase [Nonomuraea muscovyensis]
MDHTSTQAADPSPGGPSARSMMGVRGDGLVTLRQYTRPDEITGESVRDLVDCWIAVTNTGGAAGFPFPPVDTAQVTPVADRIIATLDPERSRLLVASLDDMLAGWMHIRRDLDPLVAHWGSVHHVQSHPLRRGRGIGSALMEEARRIAREEMRLEQLRLTARAGVGLEAFYTRLGWQEIGRWPKALRLSADDDRDEILMVLAPL